VSVASSTIREFALAIVRAESLEEKLVPPPRDLSDDGREGEVPRAPGRPSRLRPVARERTPMPRPSQLASPEKRAVCLHRFANHELQAVEVMAWALLAYPDAPEAFRRGVLATLADEQAHLGLYIERLAALGRELGDFPVNDYFWARTGDWATPLHYVASMGLTFEAANLDHTHAYREAFVQCGDVATASILERIHRDEIGHVAFAAAWLRKMKSPEASDWDAWIAHLPFPLGPHRARGPEFQPGPRLEAGLSPELVERVRAVPARMLGPGRPAP
jgi:uncharacterized ferritin-like protein (DUF455 family)